MENDPELQNLIRRWSAPEPSPDLDRRMMARYRLGRGWRARWKRWRNPWRISIPVPAPAAVLIVVAAALAIGRWPVTPRVIVRTERVEVPVVRERAVPTTVYRTRVVYAKPATLGRNARELQPVSELRPFIIGRDE
jgi:hypothetical protein